MTAKTQANHASTDVVKLGLLLSELRLPAMKQMWPQFAQRADTEGWPAAHLPPILAELELAERDRRRIERHLKEVRLVHGKTLASFDFNAVAAVDRLVHHATILEMNVESYRRRHAVNQMQKKRGRSAKSETDKHMQTNITQN